MTNFSSSFNKQETVNHSVTHYQT